MINYFFTKEVPNYLGVSTTDFNELNEIQRGILDEEIDRFNESLETGKRYYSSTLLRRASLSPESQNKIYRAYVQAIYHRIIPGLKFTPEKELSQTQLDNLMSLTPYIKACCFAKSDLDKFLNKNLNLFEDHTFTRSLETVPLHKFTFAQLRVIFESVSKVKSTSILSDVLSLITPNTWGSTLIGTQSQYSCSDIKFLFNLLPKVKLQHRHSLIESIQHCVNAQKARSCFYQLNKLMESDHEFLQMYFFEMPTEMKQKFLMDKNSHYLLDKDVYIASPEEVDRFTEFLFFDKFSEQLTNRGLPPLKAYTMSESLLRSVLENEDLSDEMKKILSSFQDMFAPFLYADTVVTEGDDPYDTILNLKVGDSYLWKPPIKDHAALLLIKRETEETYGFTMINTGNGISMWHPRTYMSTPFLKYQAASRYTVSREKFLEYDKFLFKNRDLNSGAPYVALTGLSVAGQPDKNMKRSSFEAVQEKGSCTVQSYLSLLRHFIILEHPGTEGEKLGAYKTFKTVMMRTYAEKYQLGKNPKFKTMLPVALAKLEAEETLQNIAKNRESFNKAIDEIVEFLDKQTIGEFSSINRCRIKRYFETRYPTEGFARMIEGYKKSDESSLRQYFFLREASNRLYWLAEGGLIELPEGEAFSLARAKLLQSRP